MASSTNSGPEVCTPKSPMVPKKGPSAASEGIAMIDEVYEFSAPRFSDFVNGESEEEAERAENCCFPFQHILRSCLVLMFAAFMPKIEAPRSVLTQKLCDFSEAEGPQKHAGASTEGTPASCITEDANLVRNPSALRPKDHSQLSQTNYGKTSITKSAISAKKPIAGSDFVIENQAIKCQKLDGGRSRQILNVKPHSFLHKSNLGLSNGGTSLNSSISKAAMEERKVFLKNFTQIPTKPEPKECTKPEPFQLESLVRHEEEMQREMEERQRMEREEAQMEEQIPLPEQTRIPLTQVELFPHHVDHRAADRAEFNKKVDEEKALKQTRRTMVPHARPVPNFSKPFLPQKSSKETMKVKSPKFRVMKMVERWVTELSSSFQCCCSKGNNEGEISEVASHEEGRKEGM